MRVHHFLITSTLFAVPVQAQDDAPQSLPSLEAALPADVRQLLASVTTVQSLFPVNGSEPFAGNVLKADVINFSRNSELVLHNVSTPYIVIVAREVKFPDATSSYRVRFDNVVAPQGSAGIGGSRGADGEGESNFTGHPGAGGSAGTNGGPGARQFLPHVYFVVDHFSVANDPAPRSINLAMKLTGIAGGIGGAGGAGGDGGNGARGHRGSDGPGRCRHAGGRGGAGGNAAVGGVGGDGAQGTRGGSLTFVSTGLGVSQFGYAPIQNQGGVGGGGGAAGRTGRPGGGGSGGRGSHFCNGGNSGSAGASPAAASPGNEGGPGMKGKTTLISVPLIPALS